MLDSRPKIDATGLQILRLLYFGFDDASVARRLGLGHRTVQRRVHYLMQVLGAKGRVALGARAQQLGLLTQAADPVLAADQRCDR
ncbi:DNA-binding response regulator [Streptomyces sp. MAR4 CNX-425]|uniref:DNA-binding response regulator n=1 Tax=Streptomyces sp. MAR4 CNX-425 TaxID=3406343 RepID=UPI003B50895B